MFNNTNPESSLEDRKANIVRMRVGILSAANWILDVLAPAIAEDATPLDQVTDTSTRPNTVNVAAVGLKSMGYEQTFFRSHEQIRTAQAEEAERQRLAQSQADSTPAAVTAARQEAQAAHAEQELAARNKGDSHEYPLAS